MGVSVVVGIRVMMVGGVIFCEIGVDYCPRLMSLLRKRAMSIFPFN